VQPGSLRIDLGKLRPGCDTWTNLGDVRTVDVCLPNRRRPVEWEWISSDDYDTHKAECLDCRQSGVWWDLYTPAGEDTAPLCDRCLALYCRVTLYAELPADDQLEEAPAEWPKEGF
jgi:hypothetical protein